MSKSPSRTLVNFLKPALKGATFLQKDLTKAKDVLINPCCPVTPVPTVQDIPYDATASCADVLNTAKSVFVAFQGQDGQGTYTFSFASLATGTIPFPLSMFTGSYKIYYLGFSADYLQINLYDSTNTLILTDTADGTLGDRLTAAFDITQLDHITFGCVSSG